MESMEESLDCKYIVFFSSINVCKRNYIFLYDSLFLYNIACEIIMDIVVTIPKSRQKDVEAEEKEVQERLLKGEKNIVYYWSVAFLPKLSIQRIYFVWDEAIRAYHDVTYTRVEGNGECRIYMLPEIHTLPIPIPMVGFRNFKYFKREEYGLA